MYLFIYPNIHIIKKKKKKKKKKIKLIIDKYFILYIFQRENILFIINLLILSFLHLILMY